MAHEVGKLFSNLGIAGWGDLEPVVLAAMRTKTPVLLIGDRGTSKTEFAYRVCLAVQGGKCNFQKYDTADATLDDILGLPDLHKLESGEVGYIGTGTSIWKKTAVIWTEVNRASPMFQGKLLEVVRTGTIHGMPTSVDYQFADCNPPRATKKSVGHDTYYMQDALGARFFCVHVPRGSSMIYEQAMDLAAQREAFDNNDTKAVGKFCAPLMNLWLDYTVAEPTTRHMQQARGVVKALLSARDAAGTYFDVRAAIRTTNMLSALFMLHDLADRSFNIIEASVKCVIGNIPELNGILRNDKTEEDLSAWESDIKLAMRNNVRSAANPANQSAAGMAFKMLRDGTFDNIAVNDLVNVIQASSNKTMGLNGLFARIPWQESYASEQYHAGHKLAVYRVLESLDMTHAIPEAIKLPQGPMPIDSNLTAEELSSLLSSAWFEQIKPQ